MSEHQQLKAQLWWSFASSWNWTHEDGSSLAERRVLHSLLSPWISWISHTSNVLTPLVYWVYLTPVKLPRETRTLIILQWKSRQEGSQVIWFCKESFHIRGLEASVPISADRLLGELFLLSSYDCIWNLTQVVISLSLLDPHQKSFSLSALSEMIIGFFPSVQRWLMAVKTGCFLTAVAQTVLFL